MDFGIHLAISMEMTQIIINFSFGFFRRTSDGAIRVTSDGAYRIYK